MSDPNAPLWGYIRVAKGHLLPSCPFASCSFRSPMANRSARATASLSSDVRLGLTASLRISDRCCSSSSLVRHSIYPPSKKPCVSLCMWDGGAEASRGERHLEVNYELAARSRHYSQR